MSAPRLTPRGEPGIARQSSVRSGGHVGSTLSQDDSTLQIPGDARASGALTARNSSRTAARRNEPEQSLQGKSKAEFQRMQKKKEHSAKHEKIVAQREKDEINVKERAVQMAADREKKFNDAMIDIQTNDFVRVEAAHIIQQYEMEQEKKRQDMYNQWDRQVSQRIELQLQKFMTRKEHDPPGHLNMREELLPSDDPAKRCLVEQRAEDHFRRIADSIIHGSQANDHASLTERIKQRQITLETVANRSTTRPVLPVHQWGQQELFAGPYGYFSQRCERMDRGEPFHSTRRMGADKHKPDERDGVQAAGKKREKTRNYTNYNHMGMLNGDHCKVGEAYKHKGREGGGSAAPMQDHYFYEKGNTVVDNEFPVGKRCFPHLAQC